MLVHEATLVRIVRDVKTATTATHFKLAIIVSLAIAMVMPIFTRQIGATIALANA